MARARARALTTHYRGCRFRSRLEARWAVLFDATGTPWCYEPQGYLIDSYVYLPDFWLPSLNSYFEVKGLWDDSVRKAVAFGAGIDDQGMYLAVGDIPDPVALSVHGWTDRDHQVTTLTKYMFEWEMWFPPEHETVQLACIAARSARFNTEEQSAAWRSNILRAA